MLMKSLRWTIGVLLLAVVLPSLGFASKTKDESLTFIISGNLEGRIEGRKG